MESKEKMRAFHGDPAIKEAVLVELAAQRTADRFVQGDYWTSIHGADSSVGDGRGCAVGCTINALAKRAGIDDIEHGNHLLYEDLAGIPAGIAILEDRFFENLPKKEAVLWPERFAKAIAVGADLSRVQPLFGLWLLQEFALKVEGLSDEHRELIEKVAAVYKEWAETGVATEDMTARALARARALALARARASTVQQFADKLIELLEAAPAAEMAAVQ